MTVTRTSIIYIFFFICTYSIYILKYNSSYAYRFTGVQIYMNAHTCIPELMNLKTFQNATMHLGTGLLCPSTWQVKSLHNTADGIASQQVQQMA